MRLSLPYQRRLAGETVEFHIDGNAAFTVAAALAAGMLGQAVAQHLRLPGIVLLLFIGFLLGPDVANVVQPGVLGDSLNQIVGFAVAVILFEGGMSLNLRRLRREERPIRQLVTVGALVSLATGACLVWLAKGWGWQRSLLFGTLVVVTGPTVVTPLLRRIRVKKTVSTILEAEGVLIDAIGAITAAVALEIVLQPSNGAAVLAGPSVFGRLAFGATCGLIGGGALSRIAHATATSSPRASRTRSRSRGRSSCSRWPTPPSTRRASRPSPSRGSWSATPAPTSDASCASSRSS